MEKIMYDAIEQIAYDMRLFGLRSALERRCQEALATNMHPSDLVRLLLEDEQSARRQAVAKRLANTAKFRSDCTLEDWDTSLDRGISKAKLKELGLINFYYKKQNLLIEGKTGVGKTHLAIALGKRICDDGGSTRFFSTNLFFEEASAEKASGRYIQFIRRLAKTAVLIFDDFALRNYTHDEANILLEVLEERYGKGIVIVTSQVSPHGWTTLFEDSVIAEAITDRLRNPSETVSLTGSSVRKKNAKN
jgi:DNA replication protein DnaC